MATAAGVLTDLGVKKVLGVAFVGSLILAVALWVLRHERDERDAAGRDVPSGAIAASTSTPLAVATTSPVIAVTVATPATPVGPSTAPAAASTSPPSDATACAKLADLCSTSDEKVDVSQCERQLADARKMSGAANVERSTLCLYDAKTCAAASGCISGGVGMGAMGEFLKGLGGAMSR